MFNPLLERNDLLSNVLVSTSGELAIFGKEQTKDLLRVVDFHTGKSRIIDFLLDKQNP